MVSEGLLFPALLQAVWPGLLSVRTMHSTARCQEGSWKWDIKPPEKLLFWLVADPSRRAMYNHASVSSQLNTEPVYLPKRFQFILAF